MLSSQSQENWQFHYQNINKRQTLSLKGGLSAEICFAKYIAFKKSIPFVGYYCQVPKWSYDQNFVKKTLTFIYKEIKNLKNNSDKVLYSPGVCSVPYLVQTCDLIYLPSHILLGVTSIQMVKNILQTAKKAGYKCYAVIGHDSCLKNTLCAWIKFIEIPQQYINLIKQLNIQEVILMAHYDPLKQNLGSQRNTRLLYSSCQQKIQQKMPKNGDIYMLYMKQSYGKENQKDVKTFTKYINDMKLEDWQQLTKKPIVPYIHSWESGIDCLQNIEPAATYQLDYKMVKFTYILSKSSWDLYKIAYFLGKKFITKNYDQKINPHSIKGVVFNQYFMSNPTYQLGYGYIPALYWQFYPKNQERLLQMLSQQQKKLSFWFNIHQSTALPFSQQTLNKLCPQKKPFVIKTTNKCIQLGQWITKHSKKTYQYINFLTIQQMVQVLKQQKLIYKSQFRMKRIN